MIPGLIGNYYFKNSILKMNFIKFRYIKIENGKDN